MTARRGLLTPNSAPSHSSSALTAPADLVILPGSLAGAGAAPAPASTRAPAASAASAALRRGGRTARGLRAGGVGRRASFQVVALGLLEALLRPRLVELDPHPALFVLHERQARPERPARAGPGARDGPFRPSPRGEVPC